MAKIQELLKQMDLNQHGTYEKNVSIEFEYFPVEDLAVLSVVDADDVVINTISGNEAVDLIEELITVEE